MKSVKIVVWHAVPVLEVVRACLVNCLWGYMGESGAVFDGVEVQPISVFTARVCLKYAFDDFSRLALFLHFFKPSCSAFPLASVVTSFSAMHEFFKGPDFILTFFYSYHFLF